MVTAMSCSGRCSPNHISYEKMLANHWVGIVAYIKSVENGYTSFINTGVLRYIDHAHEFLGYKTMYPTSCASPHDATKISPALGYGMDTSMCCHTDVDFASSVVTVHKRHHQYQRRPNRCLFLFPRLGIAAALRPGDVLFCQQRL